MKKSTIFALAAGLALVASSPVMAQDETTEEGFPYEYILTPTPGSTVEDLMQVTVAFPTTAVYFYDDVSQLVEGTLENLTTGDVYVCQLATRNTRTTYKTEYTLTFVPEDSEEEFPQAEPITAAGVYQLTLRQLFTLDANEEMEWLPWIYETYLIDQPVPYTLSPEPGLSLESISTITVDFYMNRNVAVYENNRQAVAVLENDVTGDVYNCYEPERLTKAESEGAVYQFVFLDEEDQPIEVTTPGNYTLTLRGFYLESVDEDGEPFDLQPIVANYIIGYPYEYVLTPENGESVDQIDYVVLNFVNSRLVNFMPDYRPAVAYLTNLSTGSIYTCKEADWADRYETEGRAYYLYFCDENDVYGPVTEDGEYVLSIRGLVEINDDPESTEYLDPLPPIEAKYYVGNATGIAATIAADSYNVFNLNGIQVINNGNAESLKSLNAGMYIINGKKVILRK